MKLHFPLPRHVKTRYIRLNTGMCQACWTCIDACPNQVIGKASLIVHKHAHIDQASECKGCKKCVKACPNGAISAVKEPGKRPERN